MAEGGRKSSRWVPAVLGMLLGGGVAGYFVGRAGKESEWMRGSLEVLSGWDLLALPVIWLLVVGWHEAGHLAAGISRGMRFLLIIVGPVGLARVGERIRPRWYWSLGAMAGLAVAVPAPDRPLRTQLAWLALGGPAASLVLAVLGFAMAWQFDGRLGAYALVTGALSGLICLFTALPMRAGGFMSDGLQFLQVHRDPGMVERRARLVALMGMSLAGTRPRDLDATLLAQAQALTGQETMYDIGVWLYSHGHALDRGDIAAAAAWLDRIEPVFEQYPDGFRQALAVELALFEAMHRQRAGVAQGWLARAKGGVVDASRRALAQAAVARLQGRTEEATGWLDRAGKALGRGMDPGHDCLSADQIAALRQPPGMPLPSP